MVARHNPEVPFGPDTRVILKGRHMARALIGYVGISNDRILASEVARLRRRVTELEAELADQRASHRAELDLELHRIAEAAESVLT
jgi:hypothetical protein